MEKILTVNVDYFNKIGWGMVTHIKDIDNKWERKSILNQTIKLISVVSSYDKIIFTYDVYLYFFIIIIGKKK